MRIFKNNDPNSEIPISAFAYTLACLKKANWTKHRGPCGTYEYDGYSNKNLHRASIARHTKPYAYAHYNIIFNADGQAFIENSTSAVWVVAFDNKEESKKFKHNVIMPNYFSFKIFRKNGASLPTN